MFNLGLRDAGVQLRAEARWCMGDVLGYCGETIGVIRVRICERRCSSDFVHVLFFVVVTFAHLFDKTA